MRSVLVMLSVSLSLCVHARMMRPHTNQPNTKARVSSFAWNPSATALSKPSPKLTAHGIVETPGIEPLHYSLDGTVKVFHLTAQPVQQQLTDTTPERTDKLFGQLCIALKNIFGLTKLNTHQTLCAWGYNGTTPGPVIEATEGDTIRIVLKNDLPEPTSLRFLGLEHPHELDQSLERQPVYPGHKQEYEFTVHTPGTYLYHAGTSIAKQVRFGLSGMLVIHPVAYDEPVDRHIALFLQEWALPPKKNVPNVMSHRFNWFSLNGLSAPSIPIICVEEGQRIRFHFGSLSLYSYPLHLHGSTWTLIGTEGGFLQKTARTTGATLQLTPGTTRVIDVVASNPGTWPLYSLTRHRSIETSVGIPREVEPHGGIFTLFHVYSRT